MNMRLIITSWCVVFIFSLLASCAAAAPSEGQIQTAIAQTYTAAPSATASPSKTSTLTPTNTATQTPTPTETPSPISAYDLTQYLILDGDLPAGYGPAQVMYTAPKMFDDVENAEIEIYQSFEHNGGGGGGVTVFVYDQPKQAKRAFNQIYDGFGDNAFIETIRDMTVGSVEINLLGFSSIDLSVVSCNILIHVRFTDTTNLVSVATYAFRLMARLNLLIPCPV